MADRKDYYYKQKVTEAELDAGFEGLEEADRAMIADLGLVGVAFGSVVQRGVGANISVDVNPHYGYDDAGQRIFVPGLVNLPVAVDYLTASTDVSTSGRSKILSVFLVFQRNLSDPRLDGNSVSVFFDRAESFALVVKQGAEAITPTGPPLEAGKILICDITRTFGQTQILNSNISFARRQDMFRLTGAGPVTLTAKTAKEALQLLQDALNAHISNAGGAHAATAVSYAGGPAWRDSTTNPATTVEAQLDKIVTDLGDSSVNGAARISSLSVSGVNVLLSAGSTRSQIVSLLGQLDTLWASIASVAPGVAGSSFVGADKNGTLAAGTVRSQLQEIDNYARANAMRFTRTDLKVGTSTLTKLSAIAQTSTIGAPVDRQSQILASGTTTLPAPSFVMMGDGTAPSLVQNFGVGTGGDPTSAPACNASGVFIYGDSAGGVFASSDGGASSVAVTVTSLTSTVLWVGFTASRYLVYEDSTHLLYQSTSLSGTWAHHSVPGYITGMTTNGTGTWVLFAVSSGASTILYSTDDGVTFTSAGVVGGPGSNINGAWSDQLQRFVVLETLAGGLWTSPDGITWTLSKTVAALAGVPFLQQSVAVCGPAIACITNRSVNSINKHPYGIAYTLDAGATWFEERFGDPTGGNPITALLSANGRIYAIDGASLYQSGQLVKPPALFTGV